MGKNKKNKSFGVVDSYDINLQNEELRKKEGAFKTNKKYLIALEKRKNLQRIRESNLRKSGEIKKYKPISLRENLNRIQKNVQQQDVINQQNVQRQRMMQQRPQQVIPPQQERFNPFEHRSVYEVFGDDEGVTFFDSKKQNRTSEGTGAFFGF